jgi:tetratricopeptide (TPR) repeat protein
MPAYAVDDIEGADARPHQRQGQDRRQGLSGRAGRAAGPRSRHAAGRRLQSARSLRKTGDYKTALTYYTKALELKPDHKAAREYLGELYVETGDMAKAREQLASLTKLCPAGCEERADLQKAIDTKVTK